MDKNIFEESVSEFFSKRKKLIYGLGGIWLIPSVIVLLYLGGSSVYRYYTSEMRDFYVEVFAEGFYKGYKDGDNDNGLKNIRDKDDYSFINNTLWEKYRKETSALEKQVFKEKEEYLQQFPEEERAGKQSDMIIKQIKTPAKIELEKGRFQYAHQFYKDLAEKEIKRENYNSSKEYTDALRLRAWKDGYEIGYGEGAISSWNRDALKIE